MALLRYKKQLLTAPGNPLCVVTGQTQSMLQNFAATPQYVSGRVLNTEWEVVGDGNTIQLNSFEQKHGEATVSFADSSRFLMEVNTKGTTMRRPALPRMIHLPGAFVASTSPLALDITEEERTVRAALTEAGFTVGTEKFWDLPSYTYRLGNLSISSMFGADFQPMFDFARHVRRYGAGESILQALQFDSEKRYLQSLSDVVGLRLDSAADEVGLMLDALEIGSVTELATLINIAAAMQAVRFAKITSTEKDEAGVGMTLYYAMIDAGYMANIPLDVYQAIGSCDGAGNFTLSTYETAAIPQLNGQLATTHLPLVPTLRAMTSAHYVALQRARQLYRMLLVVRYMEIKGYPLGVQTTLKQTDRRQFFELML